jgi:hypothetical protein
MEPTRSEVEPSQARFDARTPPFRLTYKGSLAAADLSVTNS